MLLFWPRYIELGLITKWPIFWFHASRRCSRSSHLKTTPPDTTFLLSSCRLILVYTWYENICIAQIWASLKSIIITSIVSGCWEPLPVTAKSRLPWPSHSGLVHATERQRFKARALEPDACEGIPCVTLTVLFNLSAPPSVFSSIKYGDNMT